ncbi:LuxR C-terminal-related transcriptional regulator [Streptomyces collinus]|uniref:LuxR C-terminal-related transcriptional regulator n=1 Tax=Streptomyces collinus TaxID=42684 RepID=UPI0037A56483
MAERSVTAMGRLRGGPSGHGFSDRDLEYAGLARSLLDTVSAHQHLTFRMPRLGDPAEYGITLREMAVLALLSEGLTAHAIGSRLRITEKTVVKHKENIYKKPRVHDRVTAINKARALGLVSPEPPAG